MDLGTGLALFGSAKIIEKLLGPTVDYIGEGVKSLAERRVNNIQRIFSIATKKLGEKIEIKGSVSPKVLKGILEEGSFCDDSLSAEYFGGVLASSRSGVSRDDRGASIIALISRLSVYQIRTHYIFYHIVKNLFNSSDINIAHPEGRSSMETYIPFNVYDKAMEFDKDENYPIILDHVMFGLRKEHLIEDFFRYGNKEFLGKVRKVDGDGIIFQPSTLGAELFLWAYGRADLRNTDFLRPANKFEIDSKVVIPLGYDKVNK